MSPIRPTRAEIDLAALCANAEHLRSRVGVPMYAVVKSDAYGHGVVRCAKALADTGAAQAFAVSLVEEGVELRDAGIGAPVLVMGPSMVDGHQAVVEHRLVPMVSTAEDLRRFGEIGRARGEPVSVHLKIDSGMGRLGILPEDLSGLATVEGARITALATHFACADDDDPADAECMTHRQLRRFEQAVAMANEAGIHATELHAANSAGALGFPESRFDAVRIGLALYGNYPGEPSLRPVMRLLTAITQLRDVPAGQSVSYGARWTAARPSRLAVLPIGYADGYMRRLSGSAEVLVRGRRCPVVGTISMDISIADVTELGDAVAVGDEVVLLGEQGGERVDATELATRAGVIEYEVTCAISKRVPRTYR